MQVLHEQTAHLPRHAIAVFAPHLLWYFMFSQAMKTGMQGSMHALIGAQEDRLWGRLNLHIKEG